MSTLSAAALLDARTRVESPDPGVAAADLPALARVSQRTLASVLDDAVSLEEAFYEQQRALETLVTQRLGALHGQLSWAHASVVEQTQAFAAKVGELSAELAPYRVRNIPALVSFPPAQQGVNWPPC